MDKAYLVFQWEKAVRGGAKKEREGSSSIVMGLE